MKAVTLREAKARRNALVEAAQRGEQVVLMRGSKHVAAIVPLSEEDLELAPRLTDAQAERLWGELERERTYHAVQDFDGFREAICHLEGASPRKAEAKGPKKPRRTAKRR